MIPTLYPITREGHGTLSIMARPRGGDWLTDEFLALSRSGVDVVVSALTKAEADELALSNESSAATIDAKMGFRNCPIPDRGVPRVEQVDLLTQRLGTFLRHDKHVAIHCRMGIGRSGLLAAAVLVREGASSGDAWATIAAARGGPVPDTDQQRDWLNFADTSPSTWIAADFDGLFGDILCLSHQETCRDANEEQVEVVEGAHMTAFSDELIASGRVERPPASLRHAGARWVLRIDERGLRYEEDEQ
jgi:protein-tyrosine phosphatase